MPLIFFFVAWARTFSSILNKSGVARVNILALFPIQEKHLLVITKYDFNCGFFIDAIYLIEEVPAYYTSLLRGFVFWFLKSWLSVRFYQMFFLYLSRWKCVFLSIISLIWFIIEVDFQMINQSCIFEMNSTCHSFLYVARFALLISCWRLLCSCSWRTSSSSWGWGTWVAQLAERQTLAQVMISQFVSSSPVSGSVLTAQRLEPASDSVSPRLSLPLPHFHSVFLSIIKKH